MPLPSSFVGASSEPRVAEIDPRWSMAYAAALDDLMPCYMDTRDAEQFLAHPMFPVCIEWPVIISMRQQFESGDLTAEEARRGVHATHDLVIHRPIRPPEKAHHARNRRFHRAPQAGRVSVDEARNHR